MLIPADTVWKDIEVRQRGVTILVDTCCKAYAHHALTSVVRDGCLTAGTKSFVMTVLSTQSAGHLLALILALPCLVTSFPTVEACWAQLLHI